GAYRGSGAKKLLDLTDDLFQFAHALKIIQRKPRRIRHHVVKQALSIHSGLDRSPGTSGAVAVLHVPADSGMLELICLAVDRNGCGFGLLRHSVTPLAVKRGLASGHQTRPLAVLNLTTA